MKRIHNARHAAEAHLVRGFLESCGIAAVVRGEWLAGGFGELPLDVCGVWITNDAQLDEADRLLRDFLHGRPGSAEAGAPWQCPRCGETGEGQFTACWQCGAARP
jgi:Putative prokaryotic signal transducing protein